MARAFSLIELLVALTVLAVVGALVIPKYLDLRQQAERKNVDANVQNINNIFLQWKALGGQVNTAEASGIVAFLATQPDSNGDRSVTYSACTDSKGPWGSNTVVLTGIELVNFGSYSSLATLYNLIKSDSGNITNKLYYCLRSDHLNEDRFFFAGNKIAYFVTFDETEPNPFYVFNESELIGSIYQAGKSD